MADNKQQIFKLIVDNKHTFRRLGADRMGLFGSFVRGDQTSGSDIDLLIEFLPGKKTFKNLLAIADYAEKLAGRNVEILTPESVSPFIAPYIQKEIEYVKTT